MGKNMNGNVVANNKNKEDMNMKERRASFYMAQPTMTPWMVEKKFDPKSSELFYYHPVATLIYLAVMYHINVTLTKAAQVMTLHGRICFKEGLEDFGYYTTTPIKGIRHELVEDGNDGHYLLYMQTQNTEYLLFHQGPMNRSSLERGWRKRGEPSWEEFIAEFGDLIENSSTEIERVRVIDDEAA